MLLRKQADYEDQQETDGARRPRLKLQRSDSAMSTMAHLIPPILCKIAQFKEIVISSQNIDTSDLSSPQSEQFRPSIPVLRAYDGS